MNSEESRWDSSFSVGPDIDLDQEVVFMRSGVRLTESVASEISARRTGRPSLGAGGPSPRIAFRISAGRRELANRVAEFEGRSISAIAREQLERYIDEHSE